MKKSLPAPSLSALFFALVLVLPQALSAGPDAQPAPQPALAVTPTTPTVEDWTTGISAGGALAPWQEAVIAAEISGPRITEVLVDVGDQVHKDQELVRLSQDTVLADLAQRKAALVEARANADRARRLKSSGTMPAQQIDQYLTGEVIAQAAMEALEIRLRQTRILAPDDGVISARTATLGAVVQTGTVLFRMVRQNRIEWLAEVGGRDLALVKPGQKAHLRLPTGENVEGEVRMVSPTLNPHTRNAIVYVVLPIDSPARAGMFAEGEILTGSVKAMTLPQSAVILRDGNHYVFALRPGNRVAQLLVIAGESARGRTEIIKGIDADARIVLSGGGFLNDGDTVQVVDPVAPPHEEQPTGAGTSLE